MTNTNRWYFKHRLLSIIFSIFLASFSIIIGKETYRLRIIYVLVARTIIVDVLLFYFSILHLRRFSKDIIITVL